MILQAASMALGGEIFILKMGVTGLKQGEKIDEELVEDPGCCDESEHPSIMALRPDGAAVADIERRIVDLEILSRTAGAKALVAKLREPTPTFAPAAAHRIPDQGTFRGVSPYLLGGGVGASGPGERPPKEVESVYGHPKFSEKGLGHF